MIPATRTEAKAIVCDTVKVNIQATEMVVYWTQVTMPRTQFEEINKQLSAGLMVRDRAAKNVIDVYIDVMRDVRDTSGPEIEVFTISDDE